MCLRYMRSISAPFRSGISCRSSADPTLHFAYIASIHLSTARLREILISISQAHSFRFPQALFQRTSSGIYLFLRRVSPNRSNPLRASGKKNCLIWITTGGKPRITFSVYFFSWLKVISRLPVCWLQISKFLLIFKKALVTIGGKTRKTFFGLGGTAQKVFSRFPCGGCK